MAFGTFLWSIVILFPHTSFAASLDYSGATFTANTASGFPPLPNTNRFMAAAVWNKSIFLIGGFKTTPLEQLVEWDTINEQMIDYGKTFLDYGTWVSGQAWSQRGELVYILDSMPISGDQDVVHKFNIRTKQFITYYNLPIQVYAFNGGCLSSSENYIYVMGGSSEASAGVAIATLQVFDISATSWISNAPSMEFGRWSLSCIVHPDRKTLYAIGGGAESQQYRSTIEVIPVDTDITAETWSRNPYDLQSAVQLSRTVVYGDDILLIGGRDSSGTTAALQIINTLTGETFIEANALSYPVQVTSVAILDGILYAFGGKGASEIDEWQYYTLPQITETTSNPTRNPSSDPTDNPSSAPTDNPSTDPTRNPSSDPTDNPSNNPTVTTLEPTASPTLQPSNVPSSLPTPSPTLAPLKISTNMPTSMPSTAPTVAPIKIPTNIPSLPTAPPAYNPTIEPTMEPLAAAPTARSIITSTDIEDDLKEGRVDEANNTMDSKTRYTPPPNKLTDDTVVQMVIYTAIVLVLTAVLCVLLRFLYKRETKRKQAQQDIEHNAADHKDTVDDNDGMVVAPGAVVHHGSVDIKQPGMHMAKESVDNTYDGPNTVKKKKILMTKRLLAFSEDNEARTVSGGQMEGMQQEQNVNVVEGAQNVTKDTELPLGTRTDGNTDTGATTKGSTGGEFNETDLCDV